MSAVDYYQLLGVSPTATQAQIREAYRKLARRYHPDANPERMNGEANQRMALLNEAYAVLGDPQRRADYDRQRQVVLETQAWWSGPKQKVWAARASAEEGRAPVVFVSSAGQFVAATVFAVLVASLGLVMIWATFVPLGVGFTLAGVFGGVLSVMAVLPPFRGYVVLARDRLIEVPAFGLSRQQEFPYTQICDVYTQLYRIPFFLWSLSTRHHVVIDYFDRDSTGQIETRWFHSKRVMSVRDHHQFVRLVRRKAGAYKHRFARPTWSASLVASWEWIFSAIWLMILLFVFFGFWMCVGLLVDHLIPG